MKKPKKLNGVSCFFEYNKNEFVQEGGIFYAVASF